LWGALIDLPPRNSNNRHSVAMARDGTGGRSGCGEASGAEAKIGSVGAKIKITRVHKEDAKDPTRRDRARVTESK